MFPSSRMEVFFVLLICVHLASTAPVQDTIKRPGRAPRMQGCYYNADHFNNGERIITNEPCLNCTCVDSMLMCYLRVCPFIKPLGEECIEEKDKDDCCPKIWCPEVIKDKDCDDPDHEEKHSHPGCYLDGKYFPDGAMLPHDPKKPCEVCYCIQNSTSCVVQQCELKVEGCNPVYKSGQCCPCRYNCTYEETTTVPPGVTVQDLAEGCILPDGRFVEDGEAINSTDPCEHCYCMRNEVVCGIQECQHLAINCTPLPPKPGQCCPDSYACPTTGSSDASDVSASTLISFSESRYDVTTQTTPKREPSIKTSSQKGIGIKGAPSSFKPAGIKTTSDTLNSTTIPSSTTLHVDKNDFSGDELDTDDSNIQVHDTKDTTSVDDENDNIAITTKVHSFSDATATTTVIYEKDEGTYDSGKQSVSLTSTAKHEIKGAQQKQTDTKEIISKDVIGIKGRPQNVETDQNAFLEPGRFVIKGVLHDNTRFKEPSAHIPSPEHTSDEALLQEHSNIVNRSSSVPTSDSSSLGSSNSKDTFQGETSKDENAFKLPSSIVRLAEPNKSVETHAVTGIFEPHYPQTVKGYNITGATAKRPAIKHVGVKGTPSGGYGVSVKGGPLSYPQRFRPNLPIGAIPGESSRPIQTGKRPIVTTIPGEGVCRVGKKVYQNGQAVESIDVCRTNCQCINSEINCDVIVCEKPPNNSRLKCVGIRRPNKCCPRYECSTILSLPTDTPAVQAKTTPIATPSKQTFASEDDKITPSVSTSEVAFTETPESVSRFEEIKTTVASSSVTDETTSSVKLSGIKSKFTTVVVTEPTSSSSVPTTSFMDVESFSLQPDESNPDKVLSPGGNLATVGVVSEVKNVSDPGDTPSTERDELDVTKKPPSFIPVTDTFVQDISHTTGSFEDTTFYETKTALHTAEDSKSDDKHTTYFAHVTVSTTPTEGTHDSTSQHLETDKTSSAFTEPGQSESTTVSSGNLETSSIPDGISVRTTIENEKDILFSTTQAPSEITAYASTESGEFSKVDETRATFEPVSIASTEISTSPVPLSSDSTDDQFESSTTSSKLSFQTNIPEMTTIASTSIETTKYIPITHSASIDEGEYHEVSIDSHEQTPSKVHFVTSPSEITSDIVGESKKSTETEASQTSERTTQSSSQTTSKVEDVQDLTSTLNVLKDSTPGAKQTVHTDLSIFTEEPLTTSQEKAVYSDKSETYTDSEETLQNSRITSSGGKGTTSSTFGENIESHKVDTEPFIKTTILPESSDVTFAETGSKEEASSSKDSPHTETFSSTTEETSYHTLTSLPVKTFTSFPVATSTVSASELLSEEAKTITAKVAQSSTTILPFSDHSPLSTKASSVSEDITSIDNAKSSSTEFHVTEETTPTEISSLPTTKLSHFDENDYLITREKSDTPAPFTTRETTDLPTSEIKSITEASILSKFATTVTKKDEIYTEQTLSPTEIAVSRFEGIINDSEKTTIPASAEFTTEFDREKSELAETVKASKPAVPSTILPAKTTFSEERISTSTIAPTTSSGKTIPHSQESTNEDIITSTKDNEFDSTESSEVFAVKHTSKIFDEVTTLSDLETTSFDKINSLQTTASNFEELHLDDLVSGEDIESSRLSTTLGDKVTDSEDHQKPSVITEIAETTEFSSKTTTKPSVSNEITTTFAKLETSSESKPDDILTPSMSTLIYDSTTLHITTFGDEATGSEKQQKPSDVTKLAETIEFSFKGTTKFSTSDEIIANFGKEKTSSKSKFEDIQTTPFMSTLVSESTTLHSVQGKDKLYVTSENKDTVESLSTEATVHYGDEETTLKEKILQETTSSETIPKVFGETSKTSDSSTAVPEPLDANENDSNLFSVLVTTTREIPTESEIITEPPESLKALDSVNLVLTDSLSTTTSQKVSTSFIVANPSVTATAEKNDVSSISETSKSTTSAFSETTKVIGTEDTRMSSEVTIYSEETPSPSASYSFHTEDTIIDETTSQEPSPTFGDIQTSTHFEVVQSHSTAVGKDQIASVTTVVSDTEEVTTLSETLFPEYENGSSHHLMTKSFTESPSIASTETTTYLDKVQSVSKETTALFSSETVKPSTSEEMFTTLLNERVLSEQTSTITSNVQDLTTHSSGSDEALAFHEKDETLITVEKTDSENVTSTEPENTAISSSESNLVTVKETQSISASSSTTAGETSSSSESSDFTSMETAGGVHSVEEFTATASKKFEFSTTAHFEPTSTLHQTEETLSPVSLETKYASSVADQDASTETVVTSKSTTRPLQSFTEKFGGSTEAEEKSKATSSADGISIFETSSISPEFLSTGKLTFTDGASSDDEKISALFTETSTTSTEKPTGTFEGSTEISETTNDGITSSEKGPINFAETVQYSSDKPTTVLFVEDLKFTGSIPDTYTTTNISDMTTLNNDKPIKQSESVESESTTEGFTDKDPEKSSTPVKITPTAVTDGGIDLSSSEQQQFSTSLSDSTQTEDIKTSTQQQLLQTSTGKIFEPTEILHSTDLLVSSDSSSKISTITTSSSITEEEKYESDLVASTTLTNTADEVAEKSITTTSESDVSKSSIPESISHEVEISLNEVELDPDNELKTTLSFGSKSSDFPSSQQGIIHDSENLETSSKSSVTASEGTSTVIRDYTTSVSPESLVTLKISDGSSTDYSSTSGTTDENQSTLSTQEYGKHESERISTSSVILTTIPENSGDAYEDSTKKHGPGLTTEVPSVEETSSSSKQQHFTDIKPEESSTDIDSVSIHQFESTSTSIEEEESSKDSTKKVLETTEPTNKKETSRYPVLASEELSGSEETGNDEGNKIIGETLTGHKINEKKPDITEAKPDIHALESASVTDSSETHDIRFSDSSSEQTSETTSQILSTTTQHALFENSDEFSTHHDTIIERETLPPVSMQSPENLISHMALPKTTQTSISDPKTVPHMSTIKYGDSESFSTLLDNTDSHSPEFTTESYLLTEKSEHSTEWTSSVYGTETKPQTSHHEDQFSEQLFTSTRIPMAQDGVTQMLLTSEEEHKDSSDYISENATELKIVTESNNDITEHFITELPDIKHEVFKSTIQELHATESTTGHPETSTKDIRTESVKTENVPDITEDSDNHSSPSDILTSEFYESEVSEVSTQGSNKEHLTSASGDAFAFGGVTLTDSTDLLGKKESTFTSKPSTASDLLPTNFEKFSTVFHTSESTHEKTSHVDYSTISTQDVSTTLSSWQQGSSVTVEDNINFDNTKVDALETVSYLLPSELSVHQNDTDSEPVITTQEIRNELDKITNATYDELSYEQSTLETSSHSLDGVTQTLQTSDKFSERDNISSTYLSVSSPANEYTVSFDDTTSAVSQKIIINDERDSNVLEETENYGIDELTTVNPGKEIAETKLPSLNASVVTSSSEATMFSELLTDVTVHQETDKSETQATTSFEDVNVETSTFIIVGEKESSKIPYSTEFPLQSELQDTFEQLTNNSMAVASNNSFSNQFTLGYDSFDTTQTSDDYEKYTSKDFVTNQEGKVSSTDLHSSDVVTITSQKPLLDSTTVQTTETSKHRETHPISVETTSQTSETKIDLTSTNIQNLVDTKKATYSEEENELFTSEQKTTSHTLGTKNYVTSSNTEIITAFTDKTSTLPSSLPDLTTAAEHIDTTTDEKHDYFEISSTLTAKGTLKTSPVTETTISSDFTSSTELPTSGHVFISHSESLATAEDEENTIRFSDSERTEIISSTEEVTSELSNLITENKTPMFATTEEVKLDTESSVFVSTVPNNEISATKKQEVRPITETSSTIFTTAEEQKQTRDRISTFAPLSSEDITEIITASTKTYDAQSTEIIQKINDSNIFVLETEAPVSKDNELTAHLATKNIDSSVTLPPSKLAEDNELQETLTHNVSIYNESSSLFIPQHTTELIDKIDEETSKLSTVSTETEASTTLKTQEYASSTDYKVTFSTSFLNKETTPEETTGTHHSFSPNEITTETSVQHPLKTQPTFEPAEIISTVEDIRETSKVSHSNESDTTRAFSPAEILSTQKPAETSPRRPESDSLTNEEAKITVTPSNELLDITTRTTYPADETKTEFSESVTSVKQTTQSPEIFVEISEVYDTSNEERSNLTTEEEKYTDKQPTLQDLDSSDNIHHTTQLFKDISQGSSSGSPGISSSTTLSTESHEEITTKDIPISTSQYDTTSSAIHKESTAARLPTMLSFSPETVVTTVTPSYERTSSEISVTDTSSGTTSKDLPPKIVDTFSIISTFHDIHSSLEAETSTATISYTENDHTGKYEDLITTDISISSSSDKTDSLSTVFTHEEKDESHEDTTSTKTSLHTEGVRLKTHSGTETELSPIDLKLDTTATTVVISTPRSAFASSETTDLTEKSEYTQSIPVTVGEETEISSKDTSSYTSTTSISEDLYTLSDGETITSAKISDIITETSIKLTEEVDISSTHTTPGTEYLSSKTSILGEEALLSESVSHTQQIGEATETVVKGPAEKVDVSPTDNAHDTEDVPSITSISGDTTLSSESVSKTQLVEEATETTTTDSAEKVDILMTQTSPYADIMSSKTSISDDTTLSVDKASNTHLVDGETETTVTDLPSISSSRPIHDTVHTLSDVGSELHVKLSEETLRTTESQTETLSTSKSYEASNEIVTTSTQTAVTDTEVSISESHPVSETEHFFNETEPHTLSHTESDSTEETQAYKSTEISLNISKSSETSTFETTVTYRPTDMTFKYVTTTGTYLSSEKEDEIASPTEIISKQTQSSVATSESLEPIKSDKDYSIATETVSNFDTRTSVVTEDSHIEFGSNDIFDVPSEIHDEIIVAQLNDTGEMNETINLVPDESYDTSKPNDLLSSTSLSDSTFEETTYTKSGDKLFRPTERGSTAPSQTSTFEGNETKTQTDMHQQSTETSEPVSHSSVSTFFDPVTKKYTIAEDDSKFSYTSPVSDIHDESSTLQDLNSAGIVGDLSTVSSETEKSTLFESTQSFQYSTTTPDEQTSTGYTTARDDPTTLHSQHGEASDDTTTHEENITYNLENISTVSPEEIIFNFTAKKENDLKNVNLFTEPTLTDFKDSLTTLSSTTPKGLSLDITTIPLADRINVHIPNATESTSPEVTTSFPDRDVFFGESSDDQIFYPIYNKTDLKLPDESQHFELGDRRPITSTDTKLIKSKYPEESSPSPPWVAHPLHEDIIKALSTMFPSSPASIVYEIHPSSTPGPSVYPHQAEEGNEICYFEGRVYLSSEQIPRSDNCEFCFCFKGDIICLQQTCPPPIKGCYAIPIEGFCCPRFHCPVQQMWFNVSTTTTTTVVPFGNISQKTISQPGCQIEGKTYRLHQVVQSSSNSCMLCRCDYGGIMKCDPRLCKPEAPMIQEIAQAYSKK